MHSTREAKLKTRAKRIRKEQVLRSDWETAFRARVKAIALANEVLRTLDLDTAPRRELLDEILPRPVLVVGTGGWICNSPGVSDDYEPNQTFRHLRDDEMTDLRQPTSCCEVWGCSDFVG